MNASTSAIGKSMAVARGLVSGHSQPKKQEDVARTLARYVPVHLLTLLADTGTRIYVLGTNERYNDASNELRQLNVDVDAWPAQPAGLFVVAERTLYLRSTSAMTIIHEVGHAVDCALGNGLYKSSTDPYIQELYAAATAFVTPYAAVAKDEYFAESLRAMCEANDPTSFWPRATRARLQRIDPRMYAYLLDVLTPPQTAAVAV